LAKFELNILALNLRDPFSRVLGKDTLKSTVDGVMLEYCYDPINPPSDLLEGKPLGTIFVTFITEST
jgi:hypothetical protein